MKRHKKFIIQMSSEEARKYFLKPENYFSLNLPPYFNLEGILNQAIELMGNKVIGKSNSSTEVHVSNVKSYSNFPNINFVIQTNKTVSSYRPITLIHPYLYVDLVNQITNSQNWENIINRFDELREIVSSKIRCESLPFESLELKTMDDKKEKALQFWEEIEQESIKLSLNYNNMLQVDISNFYGSIYTHSLHWALIGEEEAKRNHKSFGSWLDNRFQWLNFSETVSIPQGNAVSDFVSELLLAYIDNLLFLRLQELGICDYYILRYRDDYRIYTNSLDDIGRIKKELIIILQRHKLALGESKSSNSTDIVRDSLKEDKRFWLSNNPVIKIAGDSIYKKPKKLFVKLSRYLRFSKNTGRAEKRFIKYLDNRIYTATIQKHLLIIKAFSDKYPNSGQLIGALVEFQNRIKDISQEDFYNNGTDIEVLVAILVDIICKNPKVTNIGVQLLSNLLSKIEISFNAEVDDEIEKIRKKFKIISKIRRKFESIGENQYLDIWLHRILIKAVASERGMDTDFLKEYVSYSHNPLVELANKVLMTEELPNLFNEEWMIEGKKIDLKKFINTEEIEGLADTISDDEIQIIEYFRI